MAYIEAQGGIRWGGRSTPDHVAYGANGHPVRCMCGWGPGTVADFREHIHELAEQR